MNGLRMRSGWWVAVRALMCVWVVMGVGSERAQGWMLNSKEVVESKLLTAHEVLESIGSYYRAAVRTERVRVSAQVQDKTEVSSVLIVRLDAGEGSEAAESKKMRIWIKAGQLRVMAEGNEREGEVKIGLTRADSPWFGWEAPMPIGTRELGKYLPPMPIPQLDLWSIEAEKKETMGDEGDMKKPHAVPQIWRMESLTPYARNVVWSDSGVTRDTRLGIWKLNGECDGGQVEMMADARTGRLRQLEIRLTREPMVIRMEVTPMDSSQPMFVMNADPKLRVKSVGELLARVSERAAGAVFEYQRLSRLDGISLREEDLNRLVEKNGRDDEDEAGEARIGVLLIGCHASPTELELADVQRLFAAVLNESGIGRTGREETGLDGVVIGWVCSQEFGPTDGDDEHAADFERWVLSVEKAVGDIERADKGTRSHWMSAWTQDQTWVSAYLGKKHTAALVVIDQKGCVVNVAELSEMEDLDEWLGELRAVMGTNKQDVESESGMP